MSENQIDWNSFIALANQVRDQDMLHYYEKELGEPLPELEKTYYGQQVQPLSKTPVKQWEQPREVKSAYISDEGKVMPIDKFDEQTIKEFFIIYLREKVRYSEKENQWYFLDDSNSWIKLDGIKQVREYASSIMNIFFDELALFEWLGREGLDEKKIYATERQLKNKRKLTDVLDLASDSSDIRIPSNVFDKNPYELNCPSGIVDLSTGVRRDRTKDDYVSQMTALDPAEGTPTQFLQMIEEGTGSKELVNFLQLALGETLLGGQQGQHFYYLRGAPRSGKGTLFNIIEKVLNTEHTATKYTAILDKTIILDTPFQKHEENKAVLRGKRMAIVNEIKQGDKLNTAEVKTLTGNDTISASFKGGHVFDFTPDFTLWLQGNFDFEIPSDDAGLWERMKVIQYKNTKPVEKQIANLDNKLVAAEGPQILQWMIEGAVKLFTEGMFIPPEVQEATAEYQSEQDSVAKWFQSGEVSKAKGSKVRRALVNESFKKYCKFNALPEVGPKYLKEVLMDRYGVTEYKDGNGIWMFEGIQGRYL